MVGAEITFTKYYYPNHEPSKGTLINTLNFKEFFFLMMIIVVCIDSQIGPAFNGS